MHARHVGETSAAESQDSEGEIIINGDIEKPALHKIGAPAAVRETSMAIAYLSRIYLTRPHPLQHNNRHLNL